MYSLQGSRDKAHHEMASCIELAVAVILIPAVLILPVSPIVQILLITNVFVIIIIELLNNRIEAVVNRISTEQHPLSGRAKDVGSAAIFISFVNMVFVWGLVLFDVILN